MRFAPWSTRAPNLPEHGDNPVHTREGGLAAGFAGAVVSGVTVYAHAVRPIAQGWGPEWVTGGGIEMWFRGAVIEHDLVEVHGDPTEVVASMDGRRCVVLAPERAVTPPPPPDGVTLDPLLEVMNDEWVGYAARCGADLPLYREHDLVHPVVWPSLANRVFRRQLVDGPWMHTRSRVWHLAAVRPGDVVVVESWETDRFTTRAGERAVVEMRLSVDDDIVVAIEHEALVSLHRG